MATRLEHDHHRAAEEIGSPPVNPVPIVLLVATLVLLVWGLAWLPS